MGLISINDDLIELLRVREYYYYIKTESLQYWYDFTQKTQNSFFGLVLKQESLCRVCLVN